MITNYSHKGFGNIRCHFVIRVLLPKLVHLKANKVVVMKTAAAYSADKKNPLRCEAYEMG